MFFAFKKGQRQSFIHYAMEQGLVRVKVVSTWYIFAFPGAFSKNASLFYYFYYYKDHFQQSSLLHQNCHSCLHRLAHHRLLLGALMISFQFLLMAQTFLQIIPGGTPICAFFSCKNKSRVHQLRQRLRASVKLQIFRTGYRYTTVIRKLKPHS